MKIGYARCSTADQNLDWQIDALRKEGCEKTFQEKVSGTRKDRPEFMRTMDGSKKEKTRIQNRV